MIYQKYKSVQMGRSECVCKNAINLNGQNDQNYSVVIQISSTLGCFIMAPVDFISTAKCQAVLNYIRFTLLQQRLKNFSD